jgi:hypothetical protein
MSHDAAPPRLQPKSPISRAHGTGRFRARTFLQRYHLPTPCLPSEIEKGAIAAKWRSSRYYDPYGGTDHPERDHKIYTLRDNWAMQTGLMQTGPDGYTDDITAPREETGCQCYFVYLYALRDLPEAMLTERGIAERRKFEAIWAAAKEKHEEPKITLGAVRSGKDKS